MIAGNQANPGPMEHGSGSYYSDEVPGVVKVEEKSADGSDSYHSDEVPGVVKCEERSADGSDSNHSDDVSGVVKGAKKSTKGGEAESKKIKISKLSANITKEILLMFFENKIKCDGKVVDVTVNTTDFYAIVEFDKSAAVYGVMEQRPLTIFGFEVEIDILDTAPLDIPRIRISGLMENTNKEMLTMYFECEERHGGGKVKNIEIDQKGKLATIDFMEKAGADAFMLRNPKRILGMNVTVEVIDTAPLDIPRIRISGLMENTNKEVLTMYFECEERHGGGKVKNIEIYQKGKLATIDFMEKAGADAFMLRNPKRILGMNVTVEVIEDKDDAEIELTGREMQGTGSTRTTGTTSDARAETEPDSSHTNEDKDDAEIELTGREMQGTGSTQTTGTTSDARAETEPDSSHTNDSKLKDAVMPDGWGVWKWKMKFWKLFGKPEASEPSIHKYKNELDKNGLTGLKGLLSKDLESWKSTMVHIAVTGMSGAGKSSFINSIRGLKPEDPGAAEVGINETTFTCNRYEHPANKSFVVWDLPGVGTPNFPKAKYLQMVRIDRYDSFIIISKDRFTELDLWLAQKIRERKKTCFFVRSNIDVTIENNARDFSKTHNETILLQTIQNNISKEFQGKGISDQEVFLISNCALNKYDFGKLNNELLSLSDGLQKETLALSLSAVTREVMEEKEKVLTDRIPKIALSIASASTKSEQKELFKKEINFYRKQFNIDEETLSENREILFLTDDHLKNFQVVFDEHKQQSRMTMKTPTALMNDVPTLIRIIDSFTWSKEKTLLYKFSEKALKIDLELLYNMAKAFYDASKFKNLVKNTST